MFDFRRITLFCLEKRLSKHKVTIFSKNLVVAKHRFVYLPSVASLSALEKSLNLKIFTMRFSGLQRNIL